MEVGNLSSRGIEPPRQVCLTGRGWDQIAIFKSLTARNATFLLDLIWIASPRLWNHRKQHRQI
jgi:hypothetical protein